MTFLDIVNRTMNRLNLTSDTARDRIGESVNDVYKKVTSTLGLVTSRRKETDLTVNLTNYPNLPIMQLADFEKIGRVMYVLAGSTPRILDELTYDELTSRPVRTSVPWAFAIKSMGPNYVVIVLDGYDASNNFTLRVEGYDLADELDDAMEPVIPESFHDILVEGALADELRKQEKQNLAKMAEDRYQNRLSDLRMFIAKSAYLDIIQNKTSRNYSSLFRSSYRPY